MEQEIKEQLDSIEQELSAADTGERKVVLRDKIVGMKQGPGIRKGEDPTTSRPYSYARAIRALLYGWDRSKVERDVHNALCQLFGEPSSPHAIYVPYSVRALGESTEALGGALVSPVQAEEIIDLVEETMLFGPNGALKKLNVGVPEFIPMPKSGQVDFPRNTQGFTGYWVGEAAAITASDFNLTTISIRPKKLAAFVIISNELLKDAVPGVETYVRKRLAKDIAAMEEKSILYGSGANRPTGLFDNPDVVKNPPGADTGANGATPTLDNLLAMMQAFEEQKGSLNNAVFIMAPRTKYTLLKIKATTNEYILEPDLTQPLFHRFKGVPIVSTPFVPVNQTKGTSNDCSFILLGDFSYLMIGRHVVLELDIDTRFNFQNDQSAIRAVERVDWAPSIPQQFVIMDGVRP